jgi:predicted nucleotidyltransferase
VDAAVEQPYITYVDKWASIVEERLGDDLLAVYRMGSLAHGGFSVQFSDIDVGIIVRRELSQKEIQELLAEGKKLDLKQGERLSLFWSDSDFSFGRFPILDRLDLIDHAIRIRGKAPMAFKRPEQDDIRQALLQHVRQYWRPKIEKFSEIENLDDPKDQKEFIRTFLYPARFLYSWFNLKLDSNNAAVDWIQKHPQAGLNNELLCKTLDCRYGKARPSDLLPCKQVLKEVYAATFKIIGHSPP